MRGQGVFLRGKCGHNSGVFGPKVDNMEGGGRAALALTGHKNRWPVPLNALNNRLPSTATRNILKQLFFHPCSGPVAAGYVLPPIPRWVRSFGSTSRRPQGLGIMTTF